MLDFSNAVVYDIETFPNAFTLDMEMLHSDVRSTWEISHFRDDRIQLIEWFNWLRSTGTPMIGFNNLYFDYPVIHALYLNPLATVEQIYAKAMEIINASERFGHTIWERDRFAPQVDLFKIHHFDNKAKTTSLKALEINMRSENVVDMPVAVGTVLSQEQIDRLLVPYNRHDVKETKRFAHYSMEAINFRSGLTATLDGDVYNFNDTKIGAKLLEQRLGKEICYERGGNGRMMPRQTVRRQIAVNDIIFPYIQFANPEFQRVLEYMRRQILRPEDIDDPEATIKTKGVFTNLKARVGGIDFCFGTGGIHGSVTPQRIVATDEWHIDDIDVAALYPSIGIVNHLAPAHLGERFVEEYRKLPAERKEWQKKKGKKCVEANSLKLAGNGTYGNTNNKFSVFYDPQYTLTITINGQLMLCMLAEWLIAGVPSLQIIQINTDGITYRIHRDEKPLAAEIQARWEKFTCLTLESASYGRMWIRDVNNYIAEPIMPHGQNEPPVLKQKGAYWHPESGENYAKSISEAQPPAWHKDLGNLVSIKAAVAAMVHGIDPEAYIRLHSDKFDFMCRAKVDRSSTLLLGNMPVQKTTRYYVSTDGAPLVKFSPPAGQEGTFKRKNGVSQFEYENIMRETGGEWDARVCTGNKSRYETRQTNLQAGWKISECNDASKFSFDNVDYSFYVAEAQKLIIA